MSSCSPEEQRLFKVKMWELWLGSLLTLSFPFRNMASLLSCFCPGLRLNLNDLAPSYALPVSGAGGPSCSDKRCVPVLSSGIPVCQATWSSGESNRKHRGRSVPCTFPALFPPFVFPFSHISPPSSPLIPLKNITKQNGTTQ